MKTKVVLLGDSGVGKSCIVNRFATNTFDVDSRVTVGAAFVARTIEVNKSDKDESLIKMKKPPQTARRVKFEIWDTAGQERYHSLAPMYYRGAAAAIIVYDIQSQSSFARAKSWVRELQKQGNAALIMALAGNKCDMEEKREVQREEAEAYASENGLFFMETSAKTAVNVTELFHEIAVKLPKAPAPTNGPGVVLTNTNRAPKTSQCC